MSQRKDKLEPVSEGITSIPPDPISGSADKIYTDRKETIRLENDVTKRANKLDKKLNRAKASAKKSKTRSSESNGRHCNPYSSIKAEKSGEEIAQALDSGLIKSLKPKVPHIIDKYSVAEESLYTEEDNKSSKSEPDASDLISGSTHIAIQKKGKKTRDKELYDTNLDELAQDPKLKELYQLLAPEEVDPVSGLDTGISKTRIQRARLICQDVKNYTLEERAIILYPILYNLHIYGYHRAEIAAILGITATTVREYLSDCRRIFKEELIRELTSEDRVAESLAHYDFIKREALRRASKAGDDRASSYLRLAAIVESERNRLLSEAGYYEQVKRKNELDAIESQNPGRAMKNRLTDDIKEIFSARVIDVSSES